MGETLEVNRQDGEVKTKKGGKRFDDRDWRWIADYVVEEYEKRKRKRADRERQWDEVDRQIRMEPEVAYKRLANGQVDHKKLWMAETELPLQALALETNVTDARRMLFAPGDAWFRAHAQVTDEYLEKVQGPGGIKVLGDKNYVPSTIQQDNVDKLVEGFVNHWFRQYDHNSRFDVINAEAFKYGIGVGRARLERKNIWITEARGVRTEKQLIPVIVPCSIKNLYLEEPRPTFHSSTVLGPAHIAVDQIKYENIAIAANKGSTDPDDEDGGWMPKQFKQIVPEKNGYVRLLEMEGDIVIPRKTVKSMVLRGAIITVAVGGTKEGESASSKAVIRFRFRKSPWSSYLLFPYMKESADDAYPTGPLMKGRPVQMAATDATNRFLDSAMLKNAPPTGYDRNDQTFAASGGPQIYPYAMWESTDPVQVYDKVGGDPTALSQAALQFVNLYSELTGVLPARTGARTTSHTTAAAKNSEMQRSMSRIADYSEQTGNGPVTNWLNIAYHLGREAIKGKKNFVVWIPQYGGHVEIDADMLPEDVEFEWFGSQGPQDKQQRMQAKIQSFQMAMQLDGASVKMGNPPELNISSAIREVLREGGWYDLEAILNAPHQPRDVTPPGGAPGAPGFPPTGGGAGGAPASPLQAIQGGRGGQGAR